MRQARIAAFFLSLLAILVIINALYISHIAKDFSKSIDLIDATDAESAANEYKMLYEKFKGAERYISITVSHDDLTNIDNCFSEIIGAAEAGMTGSIKTAESRLKDSLGHLGRLSGINIDSII